MEFHGIKVGEWTPARETDLSARAIRMEVSAFNDNFGMDDKHKYYIVSGVQGYKLTRDLKEIREAIEHDEKMARRHAKRISKRKSNLENMEYRKKHGRRIV